MTRMTIKIRLTEQTGIKQFMRILMIIVIICNISCVKTMVLFTTEVLIIGLTANQRCLCALPMFGFGILLLHISG